MILETINPFRELRRKTSAICSLILLHGYVQSGLIGEACILEFLAKLAILENQIFDEENVNCCAGNET